MADLIIAIDTYGSQRVTDPQRGQTISAYKMGYTNATSAILLELYGTKARDVSSKQASYHYVQIDGEVVVRHGYILLTLTADELARAERVAREHHHAGAFLWRDQRWFEFPNNRTAEFAEPVARSGPNFDPTGFRPASPSTGKRESAVEGITVEKSQRSPNEKPWYWLSGDTYPHRDLLKRHGARFSGKRRAWYWIGWELPDALRQLVNRLSEPVRDPEPHERDDLSASGMSPDLEHQILDVLAQDDANSAASQPKLYADGLNKPDRLLDGAEVEQSKLANDKQRPGVRVNRPASLPAGGEALDAIQLAIREVKTQPAQTRSHNSVIHNGARVAQIGQTYCGELTGSITGQVFCYGYAVHEGICIYVNMGGPRTGVEAIRAKLSKGDIVTVVPDDAPAVELTSGEGNSGMYADYLQTIPEARFTSLILLHDWVVHPNYGGAATTFLFRIDEAQARTQLKQHITKLVNVPVFDSWTDYLWTAGQAAMLVRPTRAAGGIDLLTVSLDATAWTRLVTGGIEQRIITLPQLR